MYDLDGFHQMVTDSQTDLIFQLFIIFISSLLLLLPGFDVLSINFWQYKVEIVKSKKYLKGVDNFV